MLVKKTLYLVAVLFLVTTVVLFVHLQELGAESDIATAEASTDMDPPKTDKESSKDKETQPNPNTQPDKLHPNTQRPTKSITPTPKQDMAPTEIASQTEQVALDDVHVFYYPWYANVETDGKWNHWDHHILPHWNDQTRKQFKHGIQYKPPDDIGANFYPQRGPYSSKDPKLIDSHMEELSGYVVVISWWGRKGADGEGFTTNALVPAILKSAEKYGTYIAMHLEPYEGRNAQSVKKDIEYLYNTYGSSPALYRSPKDNNRIVVYVYDSYHTPAAEWATVLAPDGSSTIRGTPHDAVVLGLYLNGKDKEFLVTGHFNGFYTYFAANGFTEGSTYTNWKEISDWANNNNLLFSLSLGPGYDDTRIRPWNSANRKSRNNGQYYETQWNAAMEARPSIVSITSYNEWHEGTQIEASIPKSIDHTIFSESSYKYEDFLPHAPDYYMTKTHEWAVKFVTSKTRKK